jgi:hypothetical protein
MVGIEPTDGGLTPSNDYKSSALSRSATSPHKKPDEIVGLSSLLFSNDADVFAGEISYLTNATFMADSSSVDIIEINPIFRPCFAPSTTN